MILNVFFANVLVERSNIVHEIQADIEDFIFQQAIDYWYDSTDNIVDFKLIGDFTKNFPQGCPDMLTRILYKSIEDWKNATHQSLFWQAVTDIFQF